MVSLADSLVASSSRPLGLRMRADLTARRHRYQGRSYWVVKEPVGLRYFRFQEEEFAVLNMLKSGTSLAEVKERFEKEFAPHKITFQDLQQFIGTLHRSGLVISDAPGQGKQLKKRADERNYKELLAKLSNLLALRFKGIDPERILNFIYPVARWLFTPMAAGFFGLLALTALLLIAVHFDVFRSRLPAFNEFFGPGNWWTLIAVLAVTKVLHEFGHGLLCKHFGGECHEMGVMFLVLTPCLYCNVSDSWMLPSKWQRAAIGAGGIYIELILASIATFVWWFSEPSLLNHLALRVMFICSISTVLFNGNPLLRFDGYYILADLIEIPNLRQKASKILQQYAAKWCLGIELPEDPFLPQRNQAMFALYTIAAVTYRWFVFFSILFFLNQVFEPYGLKIIGQMIAITGIVGLVVHPLWSLGKFLHLPGRMDQMKWPRLATTIGVVLLLILSVLLIPFPRNIWAPVFLRPSDAKSVFVETEGKLEDLPVRPGEHVEPKQLLARLSNPQLERELRQLQSEKREFEATLRALERISSGRDERYDEQIVNLRAEIAAREESIAERQRSYDRLTIHAPIGGTVMTAPLQNEKTPMDGELPNWYGSPFDPWNQGVHLKVSDLLCQIGNPAQMEAVLLIDQADIDFIQVGQAVKIVLNVLTGERLKGEITSISKNRMPATPQSLSNQKGGTLATRTDAQGVERPLNATYQAKVPLDNQGGMLQPEFRGQARVRAGYQTIGERLWRYLMRTFHFEL